MRVINEPSYDPLEVFYECTSSISDIDLQYRLNTVAPNIKVVAEDYRGKAVSSDLYTIPPNNSGNDTVIVGAVKKEELKSIYSNQMVPRSKPARRIYDAILNQAPLGRCPLCGLGHASTLDHYLPKSKYPQLSVLPINLVPSCKDCNTGKLSSIASTKQEQSLHPYFDHEQYVDDQWLYAEVVQSSPVTLRYYVFPPSHWDNTSICRVETHFLEFNLAERYAIEASNELSNVRNILSSYFELDGFKAIKQLISIQAKTYASEHKNSWQTAMFQALEDSDWYCEQGFLL